jgi:DNA polymerase V
MTGNCHVPFWSRAGVATPRLRQQFFFEPLSASRRATLHETAVAIRDRILADAGLPVTIGVARTRTLAKLFSDTAKPFGAVAILDRDHERALLAQMPVTEISGIAGRRAARLAPYGISTCLDLANTDGRLVKKVLTQTGYEIWQELNGQRVTPIRPQRPPHKVVARGGSLMGNVEDPVVLWAWAVRHAERLVEELDYHNVLAGKLSALVQYKDGDSTGGEARPMSPTARFDAILDTARVALRQAYLPKPATHMHLVATDLRRGQGEQLTLFDQPNPRRDAAAAAKRAVNERFGRFKVRSGSTLYLPAVYADPANDFDVCDVRGKICF